MEKIGFIGGYDKTDLIINVAKVLTSLGYKVLVFDATEKQKTRYIVPVINPTISYVVDFQDIDVAVGFKTFSEIQAYLGIGNEELMYDYALIDIDNASQISETGLTINHINFFVTAFDLYSLKKGVEILDGLQEPLKLTKIYFSRGFYDEEDEYLEFLALGKKVVWQEEIIYFPLESGDQTAIAENQRLGKIKFKNLTADYKNGVIALTSYVVKETARDIKNLFKNLE